MPTRSSPWIRDFRADVDLDEVGGKGLALAAMTRAGLPVPQGYVVTTAAYRAAVDDAGLHPVIAGALTELPADADAAALEDASRRIRAAFDGLAWRADLVTDIGRAYAGLGGGAVAVRSSATVEDLPELSFAGQQDTFLNVTGTDALRDAILRCWSSLWTARAIGYRARAGLADADIALAVVVQRLVPAEISGVLFTADPLTGHRGRISIDATFGLGEALVSGQVEPDHVLADSATGRVLSRRRGSKAVLTIVADGGVETVAAERAAQARAADTLPDELVGRLVDLGARVQAAAGSPQDIEWALAGGELHLLQARAITSLYPLPPRDDDAFAVWISFGAIQGMLEPMSTLGRDVIGWIFAGGARVFGRDTTPATNPYLASAGERLWIRLDEVLRTAPGRVLARRVLPVLEPSVGQILAGVLDEPGLAARPRLARRTLASLVRAATRTAGHVPVTWARPAAGRARFQAAAEELVARCGDGLSAAADLADPLARTRARAAAGRVALLESFPTLLPRFAPIMGPMVLAATWLRGSDNGGAAGLLTLTRAMPHNVTTEMDLALWQVALRVRADPPSRAALEGASAAQSARAYAAGGLPAVARSAVGEFLDTYGMRGVGEIDIGRPRWREDPRPVFATLLGYLGLTDPERAPDAVVRRGEQEAADAARALEMAAARGRLGRLRARAVRVLVVRVRELAGLRETPKFTMVRILGLLREDLLASGADLVGLGLLDRPDDVVHLRLDELAGTDPARWRALVADRRRARHLQTRRRQVPRVILGDGRTFYEGLGSGRSGPPDAAGGATLTGSPVSPGRVEGLVRVVRDPGTEPLYAGEILVCAGTDPAWTPLFLTAAGLVTEVGGMMTHGSVVAREYGIPAVVGVHEATTRLRTGQRVRLDGGRGSIEIVGDAAPVASPPRAPSPPGGRPEPTA